MIRHVAMTYDRSVIERLGLSDVIPRPKPTTTFRSFINPTKKSKRTNGDSQFYRVMTQPTESEIVRLIGMIAANATTVCMSDHFFTISEGRGNQNPRGWWINRFRPHWCGCP